MKVRRSLRFCGTMSITAFGVVLMGFNLWGLFVPLRATVVDQGYLDISEPATLTHRQAVDQLKALSIAQTGEYLSRVNEIFHGGIVHVTRASMWRSGKPREHFLDTYRMRVPVWANYVLYTLSYLRPITYRDYEFCDYRRILERSVGRCGQKSLSAFDYLNERDFDTSFILLPGHVIATAKVSDGLCYALDPDFNMVVPYQVDPATSPPAYLTDFLKTVRASYPSAPQKIVGVYARPKFESIMEVRWCAGGVPA